MSGGDKTIVCRRCGEVISMELDGCPHCGASIQGRKLPVAALIVGLVLMGTSAFSFSELLPFFVLGTLIASGGAYFLWEQYQRRNKARSQTGDV